MLALPIPSCAPSRRESSTIRPTPAMLADQLARLERKAALRARVFADELNRNDPARWFRPEPRASVQYAAHMATTAARDHRLTPQSKAVLQVLRALRGDNQGENTASIRMRTCRWGRDEGRA